MENIDLTEKIWNIIKQRNLLHIKIPKEIISLEEIEVEKHNLYHYKSPIFLEDVDIENGLESRKVSFG